MLKVTERRIGIIKRLLRNIRIDPNTGCWLWTGRLNNQAYPVMSFRLKGRKNPVTVYAHRVALEVFTRSPMPGEEAAHDPLRCPTHRHCINWQHLRWATRTENEHDKRIKRALKLREVFPGANRVLEERAA